MRLTFLALAFVTVSGLASAAAPPAPIPTTQLDFELDTVNVEVLEPEGIYGSAWRIADRGTLVRQRTSFVKELVRSAEQL